MLYFKRNTVFTRSRDGYCGDDRIRQEDDGPLPNDSVLD